VIRALLLLGTRSSHSSAFISACHAARCVARQGVRSQPVPVALVGECSIPVASSFVFWRRLIRDLAQRL